MTDKHKPRDSCYVIIRYDRYLKPDTPIENRLTVKEVVLSEAIAQSEVARLNEINADKGCEYFYQWSRLFSDGTSAGPEVQHG